MLAAAVSNTVQEFLCEFVPTLSIVNVNNEPAVQVYSKDCVRDALKCVGGRFQTERQTEEVIKSNMCREGALVVVLFS